MKKILFTILSYLLASSLFAGKKDKTLDVYWVDVEGGAATLVVTPAGQSILIDTGNPGNRDAGHTKGCSPQTFATLKATKSIQAIYQVHKNLRKDSENNTTDEFIANKTDRDSCKGHYVKMAVSPDDDSYTVSIPSHGHSRTFMTKAK
jgi:hypothetical protein